LQLRRALWPRALLKFAHSVSQWLGFYLFRIRRKCSSVFPFINSWTSRLKLQLSLVHY
jgi:hypothetical protein